jgi:hypothetical protein
VDNRVIRNPLIGGLDAVSSGILKQFSKKTVGMKSPNSSEASPRITHYVVGQALIQSDVEVSLNSPPRHPIVNVINWKSVIFGSHFAITLENRHIIEPVEVGKSRISEEFPELSMAFYKKRTIVKG